MRTTPLLAFAFALAACKSSKPAATSAAAEPKAIGATGASVIAPASWVVNADGQISYRVGTGPGDQVFLNEVMFPAKTVDDLYAAECARASAPGLKLTTPAGALYVQCKVSTTTRDGKAVELTKVASELRVGAKGVKCHFGSDDDPTKLIEVCKSLQPSATVPGGGTR